MSDLGDRVRARVPGVRNRLLRPLVRFREMRYPTFAADLHKHMGIADDDFRQVTLRLAVQRVVDEEIPGASPRLASGAARPASSRIGPLRTGSSIRSTRSRASPTQTCRMEQRTDAFATQARTSFGAGSVHLRMSCCGRDTCRQRFRGWRTSASRSSRSTSTCMRPPRDP